MPRTLKALAEEAIAVQDACNLSGVAHGFARAMSDLRDHVSGTDEANGHPIAILWADKIAHLTRTQAYDHAETQRRVGAAYTVVIRMAKGEE